MRADRADEMDIAEERVVPPGLVPIEGLRDRTSNGLERGLFDGCARPVLPVFGPVAPIPWKRVNYGP